jgi:signal peptidase complex subunit 1
MTRKVGKKNAQINCTFNSNTSARYAQHAQTHAQLRERETERETKRESLKVEYRYMVDFQGQKFVENFTVFVISFSSIFGFILGYALQDYALMRNVIFTGIACATVATLPNWPFLRRHPIEWREIDDEHPSREEEEEEEEGEGEEEKEEVKENALRRLIRRFVA